MATPSTHDPFEAARRTLLVVALLLAAWPASAGYHYRCGCSQRPDVDRWGGYERRHADSYYDGPVSDYATTWYGGNAGTTHYGY